MPGPARREPVDHEALADLLKALAYPLRLQLLEKLRTMRTVREIEVRPHRQSRGDNPDRLVARQTVQAHIDKLVEAGLVRVETVQEGPHAGVRYRANPSRLYAITEEMRGLIMDYAGRGLDPEQTSTMGERRARPRIRGPRLVLVHGVYEGRAYPLTRAEAGAGGWRIGRAKHLPVSLDYDPFVSHESALVAAGSAGFTVTDLGSKNGTWLNWEALAPAVPTPLENGDVIGVGRSLLVFLAT